ncbi:hypothetical protein [Bacillus subtilis]|uniref:hypothetical protein n=1 Tax=Bacillus subtilis TaxID=1423 RepID=UPI00129D7DE7|nr:hypothetical protein [Bacillus subtilis]QGI17745.1 hypothetical protein GII81_10530 [Bacillus subtilis]CAF1888839.1 hypothetical protein NRS6183_03087 [Bacillus subtilis]CAI6275049.1 hypothetical protein NRS6183_11515 [Bacillus subtilis]
MTSEEIKSLLQYSEMQSNHIMPNEIFRDLQSEPSIKNVNHIAFCYSYYYLTSWLYRQAKYDESAELLTQDILRGILGVGKKTQAYDYLIKKNGVMEAIGYLETVADYPYAVELSKDKPVAEPIFHMRSELEGMELAEYFKNQRNFKVKFPVKGFHRSRDSYEDNHDDGTFFDAFDFHLIPFEVFVYCVSNSKIGYKGFYLYGYLRHMNDIYGSQKGRYDVSVANLSKETKIPQTSLERLLNNLKSFNMIETVINMPVVSVAVPKSERKANGYKVNHHSLFTTEVVSYEKAKRMTKEEYLKSQSK